MTQVVFHTSGSGWSRSVPVFMGLLNFLAQSRARCTKKRSQLPASGLEEDTPRDAHQLLGVRCDASAREIQSAFRRAAKRVHPDKASRDVEAPAKFRRLVKARDSLLTG